ncbi:hypothetical protein PR048_027719 [Dryococelus australis]|uniref:Uncharacterized protein n=1 Tax=Dryococelus australis TaxID=614101 RepID=A0ABQ9GH97_9NEOP|nr:hypothetical protein PR048_027719 [Dryococelus australis]
MNFSSPNVVETPAKLNCWCEGPGFKNRGYDWAVSVTRCSGACTFTVVLVLEFRWSFFLSVATFGIAMRRDRVFLFRNYFLPFDERTLNPEARQTRVFIGAFAVFVPQPLSSRAEGENQGEERGRRFINICPAGRIDAAPSANKELCGHLLSQPMRVIEVNMELRRNEWAGKAMRSRENPPTKGIVRHGEVSMVEHRNVRVGETGDPPENPPTSGIALHDSHSRKSGRQANPGDELTRQCRKLVDQKRSFPRCISSLLQRHNTGCQRTRQVIKEQEWERAPVQEW